MVLEVVPATLERRGSPQVVPDLSPLPPAQLPGSHPLTTRLCEPLPRVQSVPVALERLPGSRDPPRLRKPRSWNTQGASNAAKLPGTSWHANAGAE